LSPEGGGILPALRDLHPVRRDLDLLEPEFLRLPDDIGKVIPEGGLAPGELDRRGGDGLLVPEEGEHLHHLLEGRLVDVPAGLGIHEAEVAVQVAPVREVDVREEGPRAVVRADAAVLGAPVRRGFPVGVLEAASHGLELVEPAVERGIGPVDVMEVPVLGAVALEVDLPVLLDDLPLDDLPADRAKRPRRLEKHEVCSRNPVLLSFPIP
jgi:hypothetical protein